MQAKPRPWAHTGKISLWSYRENQRNFPGWHLNADALGCRSLISLLDTLIDQPAAYLLDLVAPTPMQLSVPNNKSGRAAWFAPKQLQLRFSGEGSDWRFPITEAAEAACLQFGSTWIKPLREAIAGIPGGRGDYAIGARDKGSTRLWFWWSKQA